MAIVFLIEALTTFTAIGPGYCTEISMGGLDAPETGYSLGPNLLINGDLRSGLQGWTLNPGCFSLDGSGDNASLKLQQPCAEPYPSARNDFKCPPGLYTISAEIKTQTNITVPKRLGGTQIKLLAIPAKKWAMTKVLVGTNDWSPVMKAHAAVADGSDGIFSANTVGPMAGTSWFRKLFLGLEIPPPLQTYLLYPNYRGMMFSDQSQVARVAIDVKPPADTKMAQLHVALEMSDSSGKVLSTNRLSPPADGSTVATVDMGNLPPGQYRLQGYLEGPGGKKIFTTSS
ncbi:MAG TPA: hypothetical protein VKR28_01905, partial [Candidatus Binatus sp.]|nr:hypothetical protein [Candidatus Binatus sp.]